MFALSHSALNPFLFADVGTQDGTGELTIASLFGRGGYDPWEEAARLARLPSGAAVASLAAIIAGAPSVLCSLPEATVMAERLVALLPARSAGDVLVRVRRVPLLPSVRLPFGWLATVALGLGVAVVLVAAWMLVADAWAPRGSGDHARLVDPLAREALR